MEEIEIRLAAEEGDGLVDGVEDVDVAAELRLEAGGDGDEDEMGEADGDVVAVGLDDDAVVAVDGGRLRSHADDGKGNMDLG